MLRVFSESEPGLSLCMHIVHGQRTLNAKYSEFLLCYGEFKPPMLELYIQWQMMYIRQDCQQ